MGARWESALPETVINGITFTPLNTPAELAQAGTRMGNCLATYWHRCRSGHSRVFIATSDKILQAAVELVNQNNTWSVRQMETPGRRTPTTKVDEASQRLAYQYTEVEASNLKAQSNAAFAQTVPAGP